MIHEAYGHGVNNFSGGSPGPNIFGGTHHKAYFASIDSKYWTNTTLSFKQFFLKQTWTYYFWEKGNNLMPTRYDQLYRKFIN